MTFKVEEERDNVEEVSSLEEKCVGANPKVSFKSKSDEENSRGSDSGEENKTSEEVGGCNRVGESFEEKLEGENMTVSKGGTSNGIGEVGEQEESEESENDKDKSEEVGYRVGGRQGEGAGRFLLATKTFQPGQPVLMETPLVQVQQGIFGWVDRTPIQSKIVFLKTGTFQGPKEYPDGDPACAECCLPCNVNDRKSLFFILFSVLDNLKIFRCAIIQNCLFF